jgi:DNA-binding MarR family transcriptional regulator
MTMPLYRFSITHMAAHSTLSKAGHEVLDAHKLNSAQWRILGLLSETPEGCRIADIAAVTFIQPTQVNAVVRDLLTRDLIRKHPHPTDGRANLLSLTESGSALLADIEVQMRHQLDYILRNTSTDDFITYVGVLNTIKQSGR